MCHVRSGLDCLTRDCLTCLTLTVLHVDQDEKEAPTGEEERLLQCAPREGLVSCCLSRKEFETCLRARNLLSLAQDEKEAPTGEEVARRALEEAFPAGGDVTLAGMQSFVCEFGDY